jgi:hypothetical protein
MVHVTVAAYSDSVSQPLHGCSRRAISLGGRCLATVMEGEPRMIRNLYRTYLYAVCIALLIVAAVVTGTSLDIWLSNSIMPEPYSASPDHQQVVRALVSLVVVWLVTVLVGGAHYWLIRRDIADDPTAGGGAVRSVFLNLTQLVAALIFVGEAALGIALAGQRYNPPTPSIAAAIATGGLFALLQWERQRLPATAPGAVTLQRVHIYGAQLGIVLLATPFWLQAGQQSVQLFAARAGIFDPCGFYFAGGGCDSATYYPLRQVLADWGAALVVAVCWTVYTIFTRDDLHSKLRQALHLLAFGYGLWFVLQGGQGILDALLRSIIGHPYGSNDLASGGGQALGILIFGAVAVLAYRWLYAREAHGLPSGMPAAGLAQHALIAVVLAYPFWVGLHMLLVDVAERLAPGGSHPLASDFTAAGAMVLAGLAFAPVALQLGGRTRETVVSWPHRVFVLILLASGVITSAGGLVVTLQAVGSSFLGAGASDWQRSARTGAVTLLVGVVMVALFARLAIRNHYLVARTEPKPAQTAVSPARMQPAEQPVISREPLDSLDDILDALVARRISRDEAAARIRSQAVIYCCIAVRSCAAGG